MSKSEFEKNLSHLDYGALEAALKDVGDEELIALLDGKSIKVGDVAFSLLFRNDKFDLVVDRIIDGTIHTKLGKVRATNMLADRGRKCPRAVEAYLALLSDKSIDVLSGALFGLVFLQDKANLPAITAALAAAGGEAYEHLLLAIEALEKGNPFIYSPHFWNSENVWELDLERFPRGRPPVEK